MEVKLNNEADSIMREGTGGILYMKGLIIVIIIAAADGIGPDGLELSMLSLRFQ